MFKALLALALLLIVVAITVWSGGQMIGFIIAIITVLILTMLFGRTGKAEHQRRQKLFFRITFEVMGFISKSKGKVTSTDIQQVAAIMDRMALSGDSRQAAEQAFNRGKNLHFDLDSNVDEFQTLFSERSDLVRFFLEIQVQVALAEGPLIDEQRAALYLIAEKLGFSRRDFKSYLRIYEHLHGYYDADEESESEQNSLSIDEACQLLGVKINDDQLVIKRAYRKLMSEHHPDKLVAKGLPPQMMVMATQKTQTIQAAYELVKGYRG